MTQSKGNGRSKILHKELRGQQLVPTEAGCTSHSGLGTLNQMPAGRQRDANYNVSGQPAAKIKLGHQDPNWSTLTAEAHGCVWAEVTSLD